MSSPLNSQFYRVLSILSCIFVSLTAHGQDSPTPLEAMTDGQFQQCLTALKQQAKSKNISASVISQNLDNISFDHKVIVYDRRQPEFSESFSSYFKKRVNKWRIEQGRKMLALHNDLLLDLQQTYGIPPHYLMSFWGLETNFGRYKGKMSIIRSLVTLACDPRRSDFFTQELMLALKLAQREKLDPQLMVGSWAGAMGHTQFMPSSYLKYAIDGDGDNKIDLWHSVPDALTSAANFLNQLGWQRGFRWGREVALGANFGYQNSGMDNAGPLDKWHKLGVTKTNGKAIGQADLEAALIVPAGHKGPAFLVYDNFEVIMRWNRSVFYAIAVGRLADRISGAGQLHKPPIKSANLTRNQLHSLQQQLITLGFDVGKPDGIMGPATQKGIRDFQYSKQMIADGFPSQDVFDALGITLTDKQPM
jgi:membrane-bound lytic murein transglycosylase B